MLFVPTGYATNLIVAQALAGIFSHALLDERAHLSLKDAAQLLGCPILPFEHRDPAHLRDCLARCGPHARPIVLTDGMSARDGAAAPLAEYLAILPKDGRLLVDDAHGAGVLGTHGRGTPEYCGVSRTRVIQTITLSKAFGAYGGAILGTPALRRRILDRSTIFVGSTPLPLALVSAGLTAVQVLKTGGRHLRQRLQSKLSLVRSRLAMAGCRISENPGPIIPIMPASCAVALKMRKALERQDIYPPFVQYPGAPQNGYFRFVISSEHTVAQLENLTAVLIRFSKSL